ncbi:MAG TPA: SCO family protein [Rhizomicrobium sp.]
MMLPFAIIAIMLAACSQQTPSGATDITGAMPRLQFSMTRANDGRPVTANDYRGKVVALYFGYTHCPDQCPTTLANLAAVLKRLGSQAKGVRVLFVSVDPNRDSLPMLKAYVSTFAPQIDGLRGTPDQIARLTRRYRVVYRVTPASPGHPYEVNHSSTVYIFDPSGRARLVALQTDNTKAIATDFANLMPTS